MTTAQQRVITALITAMAIRYTVQKALYQAYIQFISDIGVAAAGDGAFIGLMSF